jgi:CubicO group peptidase (beta-lactamase class C family)
MAMSMLAACVIAVSCTSPSPDDRTEFALGDRGFSIVAAVEEAASKGFTGVVLAADGGEVVVVVSTGSGEAAIRPDTLFEIASTTKPFTAVAIMRLVQEGKLSLEDSIADHLPGVPED